MSQDTQYASQAMETSTARPYEVSFLVKTEEDVQEVVSLLGQFEATVTDEGQIKKLSLAYPIKRVTDGYFGYLKASMTPENAKKLETAVLTSKAVLRMLILADEPVKPAKESKKAPRKERAEKPAAAATNEDLQKALEDLQA